MSFKVKIRQELEAHPDGIGVEMGGTILEAALTAGIAYPHGCQSGNCGACKSELLSGDVQMSPYSEHALSKAEADQGLILVCRSVPWSDCEVAWLEPDDLAVHPTRQMDCRVVELADATHDIKRMRLAIDSGGPFSFSAGQYASITFPSLPPRDYSMASRPDEDLLEFHIRLVPGGAVTPFVTDRLKVGDHVRVAGPIGTCFLREAHRGPIIAMGGGSGLAPIKSIVETALDKGLPQDIHLYFGARTERDVYLEDHFQALAARHANLSFEVVLSEPDGPTARRTGFLHEALAADYADLDGAKVYLAGPPVMVESAVAAAEALGVRRQDCHADAFYTEEDKARMEATA
ncbi:MAG: 2Fe-2S iron-sulfur cluster-binding protein [Alphaproteobacteria bacterium]|nr:2Fe-2S iron-sulfur cluster-binding protein [Alphaproteobacteria bacterium]